MIPRTVTPLLPLLPFTLAAVTACSTGPESTEPETKPTAKVAVVEALSGELYQGERALAVGDAITLDETVELESGHAVLAIEGVGTLRLYPRTRLRVAAKERARLLAGKIWALIARGGEGFAVETDNAVCGVRGTRFLVELGGGRTRVAVAEGEVEVTNRKRPEVPVRVGAGEQVEVTAEEPPGEKSEFDPVPEEKAWQESAAREDAEPAADTPESDAPRGPRPGARTDKEAFEKVEKEGREQKRALEEETEADKRQIEAEEKRERKKINRGREEVEKDLERDMGLDHEMKPQKGSLEHDSIREDGKSDDMEEFLK